MTDDLPTLLDADVVRRHAVALAGRVLGDPALADLVPALVEGLSKQRCPLPDDVLDALVRLALDPASLRDPTASAAAALLARLDRDRVDAAVARSARPEDLDGLAAALGSEEEAPLRLLLVPRGPGLAAFLAAGGPGRSELVQQLFRSGATDRPWVPPALAALQPGNYEVRGAFASLIDRYGLEIVPALPLLASLYPFEVPCPGSLRGGTLPGQIARYWGLPASIALVGLLPALADARDPALRADARWLADRLSAR